MPDQATELIGAPRNGRSLLGVCAVVACSGAAGRLPSCDLPVVAVSVNAVEVARDLADTTRPLGLGWRKCRPVSTGLALLRKGTLSRLASTRCPFPWAIQKCRPSHRNFCSVAVRQPTSAELTVLKQPDRTRTSRLAGGARRPHPPENSEVWRRELRVGTPPAHADQHGQRPPVHLGDAALQRRGSDGRPPPLATNSRVASTRAAASPAPPGLLTSDNLGSVAASGSTAPSGLRAVAGAASRSPLAGHGMSPTRSRAAWRRDDGSDRPAPPSATPGIPPAEVCCSAGCLRRRPNRRQRSRSRPAQRGLESGRERAAR